MYLICIKIFSRNSHKRITLITPSKFESKLSIKKYQFLLNASRKIILIIFIYKCQLPCSSVFPFFVFCTDNFQNCHIFLFVCKIKNPHNSISLGASHSNIRSLFDCCNCIVSTYTLYSFSYVVAYYTDFNIF